MDLANKRASEEGCYYDETKATKAVTFINKHFKTQFSKTFKLHPLQAKIISDLYGWRDKSGNRRYRTANIHVPKKSFGKTMLCAAIAFFELYKSEEPSPLIVSAAASVSNASQIFEEVRYSVERCPLAQFTNIKRHTKEIEVDSLNSKYKSLANTPHRLHGFNCSYVLLDEAHVIPEALYQSLRYATAARKNGLLMVISTAGDNSSHWYYNYYQQSKRLLNNEDDNTSHYACVYEMEADGNPEEEAQHYKANPLLDSAWCNYDQFKKELEEAKNNSNDWLNFQRLRLNKWVTKDAYSYFDLAKWEDNSTTPSEEELKKATASIGVDLAETTDISSVVITWKLDENTYYTRSKNWVCEKGAKEREATNLPKYKAFGVNITDGDMVDERLIFNYITELCNTYQVKTVNFDPRSAFIMMNRLGEEGINCERVPPSAKYFNNPMVELRKLLDSDCLKHTNEEFLKFCLINVRYETNPFGEVYPVRKRSLDKICGAIALLLSVHAHINAPAQDQIIWS